MGIEKLLDNAEEGEWICLETSKGEKKGILKKKERLYTEEERNELAQNVEFVGKVDAFFPENSHLPKIESGGNIIAAILNNPIKDYQIKINLMREATHTTLYEEDNKTELSPTNAYIEWGHTISQDTTNYLRTLQPKNQQRY